MIAQVSSNYANLIMPFAPVGKAPVSLESTDLKSSSFRSLEQTPESAQALNRRDPDDRHNDGVEYDRQQRGHTERREHSDNGESDQQKKQRERQEQVLIAELSARDREVRQHETAHAAIGGQYAGAPRYQYQQGPDGNRYAIAGEVSIDTSPIHGDPEASLRKAEQIQRAAHAPVEPSGQDRNVAAAASRMAEQARIDLRLEQQEQSVEAAEDRQLSLFAKDFFEEDTDLQRREEEREAERLRVIDQDWQRQREQLNQLTRKLIALGVYGAAPRSGRFVDQQI